MVTGGGGGRANARLGDHEVMAGAAGSTAQLMRPSGCWPAVQASGCSPSPGGNPGTGNTSQVETTTTNTTIHSACIESKGQGIQSFYHLCSDILSKLFVLLVLETRSFLSNGGHVLAEPMVWFTPRIGKST